MDATRDRCPGCTDTSSASPLKNAFDLSIAPGTRHYTLVNSNEPPDDSDLLFVRSVVSNTDARLTWLTDEITKVKEELKQLEDEHVLVSGFRTRNRAVLSPLRRMPPEVLGEIFLWSLPSINDQLFEGRINTARSPWLLTQISSHWRAVALSMPSLWSWVVLDYSPVAHVRNGLPPNYSLALVETQIQRAQRLKVHFYGSSDWPASSLPQTEMFRLLSKHSSRWEEFSLGLTPELVPLLVALRDRVPLLKRLWIQGNTGGVTKTFQTVDCFQKALSLVDVGFYNPHRSVPIALPLHQLTRLHLDAPWATWVLILMMAQNLVEALIKSNDKPRDTDNSIITLPHMRGLSVSKPEVLSHLRSPALEGLVLMVGEGRRSAEDVVRNLETLIDRSECSLRRLGLQEHPDADLTAQILTKFSSITELVISNNKRDRVAAKSIDSLMETLTVSSKSPAVAPHLSLIVFDRGGADYGTMTFIKMIDGEQGIVRLQPLEWSQTRAVRYASVVCMHFAQRAWSFWSLTRRRR